MSLPDSVKNEITAFVQPGASEGWLTAERGIEMAELVFKTQPSTIVCLGVFGGRSVVSMGLALKAIGKGKVYGIDPWRREDAIEGETQANKDWWASVDLHKMHQLTMEAIWKYSLDDFCVIIRAASQRVPKLFGGGIDMIEVDGSHCEAASCRDVEMYVPQLNAGGYVFMDDLDWVDGNGYHTTRKAQEMLLKYCVTVKNDGHYGLFYRQSRD